jgi:hypothetical protein
MLFKFDRTESHTSDRLVGATLSDHRPLIDPSLVTIKIGTEGPATKNGKDWI